MGQEEERERRLRDLAGFGITDEFLALGEDDAIVLHCLPAHYGEEITEEIAYGPQSALWDEAENRLHAQKALLRPHRALIPLKDNVPTRHFPIVTVGLIVANVLVFFLYQSPDLDGSIADLAYQPCEVNDSCAGNRRGLAADVVHVALHARQLIHLAGNMLFLWIFGNNVEDAFGRVRFLVFYLLAGYAATALQTFITLWTAPDSARIPSVGASGAISGVLGAYFLLLPRAKVLTLIFLGIIFFLREIPAVFFLGIYLAFQLWDAGFQFLHPPQGGGVAVFAHLGGMGFGMLTVFLFRKRAPAAPQLLTFEEHVTKALDALPADIARRLENVAIVVEDEHRGRARPPRALRGWRRVHAGQGDDLPPAPGGRLPRPGGARAGDPNHRPPRARALLRAGRRAPRGARLRVSDAVVLGVAIAAAVVGLAVVVWFLLGPRS